MFDSILRILTPRKKKTYRGIPLLGNPREIRGHAPDNNKNQPAFSRATFGKYELGTDKRRWGKPVIIICVFIILIWIAFESLKGIEIFNS